MSTIGGPGGISGPKGPGIPAGPEGPGALDGADGPDATGGPETTAGAAATMVDKLAAEIASGALSPREAIDRLVEATGGPELGAAERAELRELLTDLVANDPYLAGLASRA